MRGRRYRLREEGGHPQGPHEAREGNERQVSFAIAWSRTMQVPYSCDVHRRCALGFCEDSIPQARFVGGARHVTCPNPALHEVHQEVDPQTLVQVRAVGRTADAPDERAIRNRVTVAELRLQSIAHIAPERVDLSRSATERNEEDLFGEWRGTTPQPQAEAPCGVCDRHVEDDERLVLSGWIVHRRRAVESAERVADRGDDRFGVAMRGGTGPPRRRAFLLTAIVPRIHMRYDRAIGRGARQQRQLEILWRSVNSDVEELSLIHI